MTRQLRALPRGKLGIALSVLQIAGELLIARTVWIFRSI